MKICPRCNSENIEEAKYCRICGFKLENNFENRIIRDNNIKIKDENLKLILFYKYDKKTEEYSISKAKIITITLCIITFTIAVNNTILSSSHFYPGYLFLDIIFTLILGSITYVIGLLIRFLSNKLKN